MKTSSDVQKQMSIIQKNLNDNILPLFTTRIKTKLCMVRCSPDRISHCPAETDNILHWAELQILLAEGSGVSMNHWSDTGMAH